MLSVDNNDVELLKKRVAYLERINQQYISTLDTLNSLGDIHGNVKQKRSPQHIYSSTRQYVCRLAKFDISGFLTVNEASNSFEIDDCSPSASSHELQEIIDQLIETGEFGWALNQNRICEPQLKVAGRRILMHVLASRTRIRGMFIGVLAESEESPSVMTAGLISAILFNSAYALESAALYRMLLVKNEELESKVLQRTEALSQAQLELKKSNEVLEERVQSRTSDLLSSNKKLLDEIDQRRKIENDLRESEEELIVARQIAERASLAKSDFLSKMSHEFRTPLNAILGFSQVLELDENFINSSNGDLVKEISEAGNHLLKLIDEILDLAKIEAGRVDVKMENINLESVLRECYALIGAQARQYQVQLLPYSKTAEDIQISVDKTLLKQVILNLLSNSIKYNKPQGLVELDFAEYDQQLEIIIRDTGIGIKKELQPYMFQAFNRLGAEKAAIEGSGIGLVITKHLVSIMGGEIHFDSEYGKGTEFRLRFNLGSATCSTLSTEEKTEEKRSPEVARIDKGFTLFYVEDNPANIRLVESVLKKWPKIKVLSAATAEQGIEDIIKIMPDVVLMDINLPKMSGYEAVKILKATPQTAAIPVIALSADAMQTSINEGLSSGFEQYLTKPLKVVEFLQLLGNLTGQALLE